MEENAGKDLMGSPGSDRHHFCSYSVGQNSVTGPPRTARGKCCVALLCDQQEEGMVWGKSTSFCCRYYKSQRMTLPHHFIPNREDILNTFFRLHFQV